MLVLSRKVGEQIVIDGGIVITITEVRGDRVRVGIEAPGHVSILRAELIAGEEQAPAKEEWTAPSVPPVNRCFRDPAPIGRELAPAPALARRKGRLRDFRRISR